MPWRPGPPRRWALWLLLLAGRPLGLGGQQMGLGWQPPEPAFQCSCDAQHPQAYICSADILIRAKILGEKVIFSKGDSDHYQTLLEYQVKPIKVFKGSNKLKDKHVQAVYTPFDRVSCGARLEGYKKKQYILSGKILADGKLFVHMCNYIEPWESLSKMQRETLTGPSIVDCSCHISVCYKEPCISKNDSECLWADWLRERTYDGFQTRNMVCQGYPDEKCRWTQIPRVLFPSSTQHTAQTGPLALPGSAHRDSHISAGQRQGPRRRAGQP